MFVPATLWYLNKGSFVGSVSISLMYQRSPESFGAALLDVLIILSFCLRKLQLLLIEFDSILWCDSGRLQYENICKV